MYQTFSTESQVVLLSLTHHRVSIPNQISQDLHESPLDAKLWFQLESLGDTERGRLPDIWVVVPQTPVQRFSEIGKDFLRFQR